MGRSAVNLKEASMGLKFLRAVKRLETPGCSFQHEKKRLLSKQNPYVNFKGISSPVAIAHPYPATIHGTFGWTLGKPDCTHCKTTNNHRASPIFLNPHASLLLNNLFIQLYAM